jgi:hypothetical protein
MDRVNSKYPRRRVYVVLVAVFVSLIVTTMAGEIGIT